MIDWNLAGTVIFSGLLIVFIVLGLLIYIVYAMGKLLGSKKAESQPGPVHAAAAPAPVRGIPAPAVQAGTPLETVAAISAAVAAYMEEAAPGVPYAVKSIRRQPTQGARPVWGFAGMRQNTRPF